MSHNIHLYRSCSLKSHTVHRKTLVSGFNEVVILLKKRFLQRCFPLNFTKFLKHSQETASEIDVKINCTKIKNKYDTRTKRKSTFSEVSLTYNLLILTNFDFSNLSHFQVRDTSQEPQFTQWQKEVSKCFSFRKFETVINN